MRYTYNRHIKFIKIKNIKIGEALESIFKYIMSDDNKNVKNTIQFVADLQVKAYILLEKDKINGIKIGGFNNTNLTEHDIYDKFEGHI